MVGDILIDKIIKDIENKLDIMINKKDIVYFTEGATESIVFSIRNKYLVKTINTTELLVQIDFLSRYNKYFQRIIIYDKDLSYICYEYIDGNKVYNFDSYDKQDIINQLYNITSNYEVIDYEGYGYYLEDHKSWYQFLLDEVEYSKSKMCDIDMHIVYDSLKIIKEFNVDKYLIHGDFGVHNFLFKNNKLKVIDPMGVVGDPLYDFYFSFLSNYSLFSNIEFNLILQYFNRDIKYKKALFIIVYYIRMSRAYVYDKDNYDNYYVIFNTKLCTLI